MKKFTYFLVSLLFVISLIAALPIFAQASEEEAFIPSDMLASHKTYNSGQAGYYEEHNAAIKLAANTDSDRAVVGMQNLSNFGLTAENSLVLTMRIKFIGAATSDFYMDANYNSSTYASIWRVKGNGETGRIY